MKLLRSEVHVVSEVAYGNEVLPHGKVVEGNRWERRAGRVEIVMLPDGNDVHCVSDVA